MLETESPRFAFLHLLALGAVAMAQPLFDILGRYPEFLVAHGVGPGLLVLMVLVVVLAIPGALALVGWLLRGVHQGLWLAFHLFFIGLFGSPAVGLLRVSSGEIGDVQVNRKMPVVMVVFDELPLLSLLDSSGRDRRGTLSQLCSARRRFLLVSQRHSGQRGHPALRTDNPGRPVSDAGQPQASHSGGPSPKSLHPTGRNP